MKKNVIVKPSCAYRFSLIEKQKMRNMFVEGYALSYIARKFACRPVAVWNNVFDLSPSMVFSKEKQKWAMNVSTVSIKIVKKIRSKVPRVITSKEAAEMAGISQSAALAIIRGKTFRWIPGWTRPYKDILVYLEPEEYPHEIKKTDKVRGCKKGSIRTAKSGELIKLAKKYKVSTTTICRWRKKGKML